MGTYSSRRKARGQTTAQRVEVGPRTTLVNSTNSQRLGPEGVNGAPLVAQVGVGPGAQETGIPFDAVQQAGVAPPSAPDAAPAQPSLGYTLPPGSGPGIPMPSPQLGSSPAIPMPSPQFGSNPGISMPSPQLGAGAAQPGTGLGYTLPPGSGPGIPMPSPALGNSPVSPPPPAKPSLGYTLPPGSGPGIPMPSPQFGGSPGFPMPAPQFGGSPGIPMPPPQFGGSPGISMPSPQFGGSPGIPMPSPQFGGSSGIPMGSPGGVAPWPTPPAPPPVAGASGAATSEPVPAVQDEAAPSQALVQSARHTSAPAVALTESTSPPTELPPFVPPPPPPAAAQFRFLMTSQGLPGLTRIGAAPTGEVILTGRPGEGYAVAGSLYGMPALPDRSLAPTLWLLHDLTVPLDLSPADLAALPRGNQPGLLFTQDGRPPSFGPQANVITIAVPVGCFEPTPEGSWQVNAVLSPNVNQTFHPLAVLGPNELQDPNLSMPSGTMTGVLTDLFLRPATLLPHLRVREQHAERLRAICQSWALRPAQHLDGAAFTRVAVTLEGPVRSTPSRLPTQEMLILWGNNRAQLA